MSGDTVVTTVRIRVNELIRDDIVDFLASQTNTTVFTFVGLPDFIRENQVRNIITRQLLEKQFASRNQLQFEQEIVDIRNRPSVINAFRAVSAQYLIEFRFTVRNYRAGESCTVHSDMSYTVAGTTTSVPVIMLEVTMDEGNPNQCILNAVENLVELSLNHMRQALVPAPRERIVLSRYTMTFVNVSGLRAINTIADDLRRRKITTTSEMYNFFDDQAEFNVESHLSAQDLAERIRRLNIEAIQAVEYTDRSITIILN
jgi:hypothetical protein